MTGDSLRVALIVKGLPLHRPGGMENHAWDLARALAARGHSITIVTTAAPFGADEKRMEGLRIVHLPKTKPGQNSLAFFQGVGRWVAEHSDDFDIIHMQGFAGIRTRTPKTRMVTTVHGTVWSETPLHRDVRPLLSLGGFLKAAWRFKARTLMGPWVHRAWKCSRRLITDSEFTRDEVLRGIPEMAGSIDVVPLGVDLPPEIPPRDENLADRPIRLLSVGRIERVKGLDDLLTALSAHAPSDRFEVKIAGDGPHRPALERRVKSLGLEATVKIHGRVNDSDLNDLYRWADALVNPEWSQPAFGLVSVEALGWGLPILGCATGATQEIVTPDVGVLHPPGQPERLGETLSGWAADPSGLLALRGMARARAELFSVGKMAHETESAYRRALEMAGK